MKLSFLILLLLSVIFFNYSTSCELYDFNLNDRVNINGHPHFRINYYPNNSTDVGYRGDFYPDLESNPTIRKFVFKESCTINSKYDLYEFDLLLPKYSSQDYMFDTDAVLIIPDDVTVLLNGNLVNVYNLIVKGKLELKSDRNITYSASKTIIYPGGVFKSTPNSNVNHEIFLRSYDNVRLSTQPWDPLFTSTFISFGGIVRIKGSDPVSPWVINNLDYGGTLMRSFPIYAGKPVIRLNIKNGYSGDIKIYDSVNFYDETLGIPDTANFSSTIPLYINDLNFRGVGVVYIHPWSKNVVIKGSGVTSMVFTGDSTVDIQNAMFYDLGHTNYFKINPIKLNQYFNTYVDSPDLNQPDRYPITLLHVTKFVTIQNCAFISSSQSTPESKVPKAFIGAKRSFGDIIGNAFVLKGPSYWSECTGVSLIYGTEQFNISYNAFISTILGEKRSDTDDDNCGILTASPYSTYENNAFEGAFRGGAICVVPIQNRTSIAGISQDQLLGKYSDLIQDNSMDFKVNNVWNSVVFKGNYIGGEAEVRYDYPSTCQPPIRVTIQGGWLIDQRSSSKLPPSTANIELIYDSTIIQTQLRNYTNGGAYLGGEPSTHTGVYNAITLKNTYSTTYKFFADSFHCKYLSIIESIFNHDNFNDLYYTGNLGLDHLKRFTDQLYFFNVNGTKTTVHFLPNYHPLFNLSPLGKINQAITSNQINISFTPNFRILHSDGQAMVYLVDGVVQIYTPRLYVSNFTSSTLESKVIQFSNTTNYPNGPYNVLVSTLLEKSIPDNLYYNVGPYFANTYVVDIYAVNFYLGISFSTDYNSSETHQLSVFGNEWTTCSSISQLCKTKGLLSKANVIPTKIFESLNGTTFTNNPDEVKMLTSYLVSDPLNGIPSSVNITLPGPHQYKFYIYSFNPTWSGSSILDSLPYFTIKINGKYQEPFTRITPSFGKYQKYGPFYWNNDRSTKQVLHIDWASDNINYQIPLSGIEIYSSSNVPFSNSSSSDSSDSSFGSSSSSDSCFNYCYQMCNNNNNNNQ